MTPVNRCPYRSPKAVSEAIKDIIQNKTVCELGCAEGDNLAFMSAYAKKVFGIDCAERRYKHAIKRGFQVTSLNYKTDQLPQADVYYAWPDRVAEDCHVIIDRLKASGFHGTVIIGGDGNFGNESEIIKGAAELYNGKHIEVPFNEGTEHRQSGIFHLAVVEF